MAHRAAKASINSHLTSTDQLSCSRDSKGDWFPLACFFSIFLREEAIHWVAGFDRLLVSLSNAIASQSNEISVASGGLLITDAGLSIVRSAGGFGLAKLPAAGRSLNFGLKTAP